MPSQPSPIFGTEQQADGENLNAWGQKLNAVNLQHEQIMGSILGLTVNADVTLTNTDYVENQSKRAGFILSGAGGFDIICPAKPRKYIVKNDCAAAVTFTHNAGGTDMSVAAGEIKWIFTDGTDFFTAEEKDYLLLTGGTLSGDLGVGGTLSVTGAVAFTDLASYGSDLSANYTNRSLIDKEYVDGLAFNAVDLPGQTGNAGKFLTTDGTNSSWAALAVAWSNVSSTPTTLTGYGITDAQPIDDDLTAIAALTTTARGRSELTTPSPVHIDNTNSPYSADFGEEIFVDCSTGAVEIDLPAATAGSLPIWVIDDDGSAPTNKITLDPDGSETVAGETSIEIDQARAVFKLVPFAGLWRIARGW